MYTPRFGALCREIDVHSMALGAWCTLHGFGQLVYTPWLWALDLRSMALGTWCTVHGFGHLVYTPRFGALGVRSEAYAVKLSPCFGVTVTLMLLQKLDLDRIPPPPPHDSTQGRILQK